MIFQREKITETLFNELIPLAEEHFKEVSKDKEVELDIDKELYFKLDSLGLFRLFTMREDGIIYGYSGFSVLRSLHSKSLLQANSDVVFIEKKFRGRYAYSFLAFSDAELRKEGIQIIYQHVKVDHNFGKLLERLGYEEHEIVFLRRFH